MTPRKHTEQDYRTMIEKIIMAVDAHFMNDPNPITGLLLKHIANQARDMIAPQEFKAERCPDTPDFFEEGKS